MIISWCGSWISWQEQDYTIIRYAGYSEVSRSHASALRTFWLSIQTIQVLWYFLFSALKTLIYFLFSTHLESNSHFILQFFILGVHLYCEMREFANYEEVGEVIENQINKFGASGTRVEPGCLAWNPRLVQLIHHSYPLPFPFTSPSKKTQLYIFIYFTP